MFVAVVGKILNFVYYVSFNLELLNIVSRRVCIC